jgi:hypothetical protein
VAKRYARKQELCKRYGGVTTMTIERMAATGRLPAPEYLFGGVTPFWDIEKLEINERAGVLAGRGAAGWCVRLFYELTTAATREDAAAILSQHDEQLRALPDAERERILEISQDLIAEKVEELNTKGARS